MKYFNKFMVFFLFLLSSYGIDTFAYRYSVYNGTGKVLKVQLYSFFGKLGHARAIKSGEKFRFNFTDKRLGFCLTAIKIWEKGSVKKWVKGQRVFKSVGLCENSAFVLRTFFGPKGFMTEAIKTKQKL